MFRTRTKHTSLLSVLLAFNKNSCLKISKANCLGNDLSEKAPRALDLELRISVGVELGMNGACRLQRIATKLLWTPRSDRMPAIAVPALDRNFAWPIRAQGHTSHDVAAPKASLGFSEITTVIARQHRP